MKKFSFWFTGMCLLVACLGITSCAEDDGEDGIVVTLQTPPFEGISALYEVEFGTSDIKSVELTESGQYIITKNSASTYKVIRKKGILRSNPQVRAIEKDNLITGVYTKVSHAEYALEGYGTLKVNVFADDGKFETITLLPDDGGEIAMDVVAKAPVSTSDKTKLLCRTWIPETCEEKEWENGQLVWHGVLDFATKSVTMHNTTDGSHFEEDEWLEKVIFSKAGTYTCYYDNNTFGISSWYWMDEATGKLGYGWTGEDESEDVVVSGPTHVEGNVPSDESYVEKKVIYDEEDVVHIEFYDNKMKVTETYRYDDYGSSTIEFKRTTVTILKALN